MSMVNIEKADIFVVAEFGNMRLFKKKIKLMDKKIDDIKDLKDADGVSLLQRSIIGRNFDISKLLLDNGAKVNNISNEGYNELHYLGMRLFSKSAVKIAKIIIQNGGDLNLKDKLYKNTSFYYIIMELTTDKNQKKYFYDFYKFCLKCKPNLDIKNVSGVTCRDLINDSRLISLIELI